VISEKFLRLRLFTSHFLTNHLNLVPVAQPDRASDFGSEGWGFESLQARHFSQFVAVMSPLFVPITQCVILCETEPAHKSAKILALKAVG
jgi:hypothetical protein